jgi:hypothetical protein
MPSGAKKQCRMEHHIPLRNFTTILVDRFNGNEVLVEERSKLCGFHLRIRH